MNMAWMVHVERKGKTILTLFWSEDMNYKRSLERPKYSL